jgi:hypothetical protein
MDPLLNPKSTRLRKPKLEKVRKLVKSETVTPSQDTELSDDIAVKKLWNGIGCEETASNVHGD